MENELYTKVLEYLRPATIEEIKGANDWGELYGFSCTTAFFLEGKRLGLEDDVLLMDDKTIEAAAQRVLACYPEIEELLNNN